MGWWRVTVRFIYFVLEQTISSQAALATSPADAESPGSPRAIFFKIMRPSLLFFWEFYVFSTLLFQSLDSPRDIVKSLLASQGNGSRWVSTDPKKKKGCKNADTLCFYNITPQPIILTFGLLRHSSKPGGASCSGLCPLFLWSDTFLQATSHTFSGPGYVPPCLSSSTSHRRVYSTFLL